MSCISILKEKGLRLTPQRRLIVDIIHESDGHLTAEDIIAFVQSKMPGVNKSTIYRTLDVLEETGCVFKSQSGDHSIYHPSEGGHHHHLVCRKCGKTIDCNENLFSPVKRSLVKQYGFQTDFQHMVIKGICKECSKNIKPNPKH
jgi:Fur family transcriptional regulator, ferric uptake regulator